MAAGHDAPLLCLPCTAAAGCPQYQTTHCLLASVLCAGKSTLLHRLVYGCYRPGLPPTYGTEFGAKGVGGLPHLACGTGPAAVMLQAWSL